MNNKIGLPKALLVVIIAIVLALVGAYVPALSMLSLGAAVPCAIIGTLADKKSSILSILIIFLALMFGVDTLYAVNICLFSAIPGLLIGNIAKKHIIDNEYNKFEPIYGGTIIFVICTIVFFFIAQIVFKVNLIDEFISIINESMKAQINIMKETNPSMIEGIRIEDIVNMIRNIIPTLLLFEGMLLTFVTYYLEVFILRRMKNLNLELPKFRDFYLPGNAVATYFMLCILVLLVELIGLNLYTELIMLNLQLVFNFMFTVQGIAIAIYYISKCRREGPSKIVMFAGILVLMSGFMGISFIGMLDSIIDFRKVRSYKST